MRRIFIYSAVLSLSFFSFTGKAFALPRYPADPDAFGEQWHLQKIEAYEAWSRTTGSSDVVVAILDTGVDMNHPDIAANLWHNPNEVIDGRDNDSNVYVDDVNGWDFIDGDSDPSPNPIEPGARSEAVHHGTVVAGMIGAIGNNGVGGAGVNWNVRIMPLRVLDSQGRGDTDTVRAAIRYAVAKGADIINLSFVGPGFDPAFFLTLRETLQAGVLVVAAVGNESNSGIDLDQNPMYPVCYSGGTGEDVVLGVAALDRNDRKPVFSNYGAKCVDLSAPGVDLFSTQFNEPARGYPALFGRGWTGSSMAAPIVSGVAALIKAVNPVYSAVEIREILLNTADPLDLINPGFNGKLGKGRVNARRAMELAASGGIPVFGPSLGIPYILNAPHSAAPPIVKISRPSGMMARSFGAYAQTLKGGVRVSAGDVNGDGRSEIVTGVGFGGGPHVRVFDVDGRPVDGFFVYDARFRGGVNVAVGDVNGDGTSEIITAPGPGGGPHIRIFGAQGQTQGGFFAYGQKARAGLSVAVADIDKDGRAEIITAPGPANGSTVKIFDNRGRLKGSFNAFPSGFAGGVNVGAGDVDGDGTVEIIVAPMRGEMPEVRIFSAAGSWQRAFLAYTEAFRGGVNLVVGDADRDNVAEIITGAGPGGGPHVVIFDGFGKVKNQFFPLDKTFKGGVSVGIIKL